MKRVIYLLILLIFIVSCASKKREPKILEFIGLNQKEIYDYFGNPDDVSTRRDEKDNIRDVWTYYERKDKDSSIEILHIGFNNGKVESMDTW